MRYRKKPVVVEAIRVQDVIAIPFFDLPKWLQEGMESTMVRVVGSQLAIITLEGTMVGATDDWLIRGVKGEFYPCKPDVFEATYEKVDD